MIQQAKSSIICETPRISRATFHRYLAAADCFKFRNKVDLDVALEALRDAWRKRKVTMADLDWFAKTDWVTNVMRPYLEMLT